MASPGRVRAPGKKAWTSSSPGPNPLRPNDRPALYLKIAHLKAQAADKLYDEGNADAGSAALQDVVAFSKKATDAAIATGKKLKNAEITLRKMAEKFRDVKRTVAFDDQAPLQQTSGRTGEDADRPALRHVWEKEG